MSMTRGRRAKPPAVTAEALERAALRYLERFASSRENLRRVLLRRIQRAARAGDPGAADAPRLADEILERYTETGLLNDKLYAEQRAASLARSGASRFRIRGKLAQKGVDPTLVRDIVTALDENSEASEMAAACALIRRRGLGPYRPLGHRAEFRHKDLAAMARAGFRFDLARRLLAAPDAEALALLMKEAAEASNELGV
jgi:regulatory protein